MKFDWKDRCEAAFQELKHKLTNAPVPALLVEGEEFTIYNDASRQGLGCVLMQDGKIIVYTSRQLKSYKQNHPIYNLDLTMVVFLLKLWRHYLYGGPYKILTNHENPQYIFSQKELNMR